MEGVTSEAASLAGHLKLGKLICLYDSNHVTLDGPASMHFSEDVGRRYEAYGWHVQQVAKGDTDLEAIDRAIVKAENETGKPSLIVITTTLGYGSPNKAGKSSSHGSPLGPDEVKLTKKALGWDPDRQFYVPDEALKNFRVAIEHGAKAQGDWQKRFDAYAREFPEAAADFKRAF